MLLNKTSIARRFEDLLASWARRFSRHYGGGDVASNLLEHAPCSSTSIGASHRAWN
jgi:hypothetical protein